MNKLIKDALYIGFSVLIDNLLKTEIEIPTKKNNNSCCDPRVLNEYGLIDLKKANFIREQEIERLTGMRYFRK